VVSRSILTEIREGRGCGTNADHVLLKMDHLGADKIMSRLPGIRDLARRFAHVDPIEAPIPVFPTAHYMMGGIPSNRHGQVVTPTVTGPEEPVPGLYAVGECACVSVHGANRLGGNSLLDIVVFGRAAGSHMLEYLRENPYPRPIPKEAPEFALARLARWERSGKGESIPEIREAMRRIMEDHCGVFRNGESMRTGVEKMLALRERLAHAVLPDQSKIFNTARIEAFELENMLETALASIVSACARDESRGAHSRVDFPTRDDNNWLKHSLYFLEGQRLDYKPVRLKPLTVDSFPPKPRVY
jgi:succinate dehydrogenase / fumarate reductase flavoprotein subunit